ncbi:MAG: class I SAM-dependent methyltransferase [SAR202 cluster bacterium]|nr:class I SAM-dependent methyltransferase [SAR202 cluster bacterium]MDP6713787.1 class I SAM-dependent methyltransferase [SAR202 cluster bacterium]
MIESLTMAEPLFDRVLERFSDPLEVAEYRRRVDRGLLKWERTVVSRHMQKSTNVLNIGCGGGREAFALSDLGFKVVGVDVVPSQIESARVTARELGEDVEFQLSDGVSLDFDDCSFDSVVMWGQAFGNIPNAESRAFALSEIERVLKPGGVVSLSVHNREVCEPIAALEGLLAEATLELEDGDFLFKGDAASGSQTVGYWHYFRAEELKDLCESAGLHVQECALARDLGQDDWDTIWVCVCMKPE